MRLTTIANDASVGALADRLYVCLTPDSRRLAETALLAANPHLAEPGGLAPGGVVRVPEVAGLSVNEQLTSRDPVGDVLNGLIDIVSDYQRRLSESTSDTKKEVADQVTLLKSRAVRTELKKLDKSATDAARLSEATVVEARELAGDIQASLAKSLDARSTELSDRESQLSVVFETIVKDLKSLADRAG